MSRNSRRRIILPSRCDQWSCSRAYPRRIALRPSSLVYRSPLLHQEAGAGRAPTDISWHQFPNQALCILFLHRVISVSHYLPLAQSTDRLHPPLPHLVIVTLLIPVNRHLHQQILRLVLGIPSSRVLTRSLRLHSHRVISGRVNLRINSQTVSD